ncbi:MAG: hypothetical protein ACR2OX_10340, partial [Methyloligellaceae bacterium]
TMYLAVVLILRLNNIPFALTRARMVDHWPVAANALTPDILDQWQAGQRLWRLSLMTSRTAANLKKQSVILYIILFVCSLPLLVVIMSGMLISGAAHDLNGTFAMIFAIYGVLSVWAFLESSLVLRRRLEAGRRRRLAHTNEGGAQSDPAQETFI